MYYKVKIGCLENNNVDRIINDLRTFHGLDELIDDEGLGENMYWREKQKVQDVLCEYSKNCKDVIILWYNLVDGDLYVKEYYKSGKYQVSIGTILYEEFNENKLD